MVPWDHPDDYRRYNGVLRFSQGDQLNGFTLTAMGYNGDWNATDQVPRRAVESGLIGRFGTLDTSDGGETHRLSLSGEWRRSSTASMPIIPGSVAGAASRWKTPWGYSCAMTTSAVWACSILPHVQVGLHVVI